MPGSFRRLSALNPWRWVVLVNTTLTSKQINAITEPHSLLSILFSPNLSLALALYFLRLHSTYALLFLDVLFMFQPHSLALPLALSLSVLPCSWSSFLSTALLLYLLLLLSTSCSYALPFAINLLLFYLFFSTSLSLTIYVLLLRSTSLSCCETFALALYRCISSSFLTLYLY
jgi:hypothetical protein